MKEKKKDKVLTNWQLVLLSTIVFLLLIFFFDSNNIRYKRSLDNRFKELSHKRDSLREQIERDSIMIYRLKTDNRFLERYAREHYYMKRENEDLFVVK
ncbi:MAG: septum formation initiator family protein [Rikenellaceae bacterium]|nr:septum formation initiator family protein [Rikenellaceae bacterium]MDE7355620.1 septum formation initiator family protein [Rikenellaceae bacterium]